MLGWHWLKADRKLQYGDGRVVVDGEWLDANGPPVLCSSGMHASERVTHALKYAPGSVLCRVEIDGAIHTSEDKFVGARRKSLWSISATEGIELIVEFARWCADRAKTHAAAAYAARAAYAADAADAADAAAHAAAHAADFVADAATYAVAADFVAAATYAVAHATEREAQEQWWLTKLAAIRGCEIGVL